MNIRSALLIGLDDDLVDQTNQFVIGRRTQLVGTAAGLQLDSPSSSPDSMSPDRAHVGQRAVELINAQLNSALVVITR